MKTSIIKYITFLTFTAIMMACGGNNKPAGQENTTSNSTSSSTKKLQWNISIFLDLSDRISPSKNLIPSVKERDMSAIAEIVQLFKEEMTKENAYKAKGHIKVFFNPTPTDPQINSLANKLEVDLSAMTNKEKKVVYNNINNEFQNSLNTIYDRCIESKNWIGSDIWGFFKRGVTDFCIEEGYRNILVIITDGYLYHIDSKQKTNNRYSYLLGPQIQGLNLRNNSHWKEEIERTDIGLIAPTQNLDQLEVLFLELNPEQGHPEDLDILEFLLEKWLKEMGVKKYRLYPTDIPANTKHHIKKFFAEQP